MKNLIYILLLFPTLLFAQEEQKKEVVQLTGVVVGMDSLQPVPFTSIIIKNTHKGTISDYYGYFSLVAESGDTIRFSSISYKNVEFVIPYNLENGKYSLIQKMEADTIMLQEVVIRPWPTREQFRQAFINLKVPDDDLERARKNLERQALKDRLENGDIGDGKAAYSAHIQQENSRLYYAGQAPPIQLLNPLAWAEFIKAWKRGDFKRKD